MAVAPSLALAQYAYPAGYGGWGGWGGATTAAGSRAMGMGAFAAGAGAYNEQTAEARSMNAQTAMGMNEYLYQSQQNVNRQYQAELANRQKQLNVSAETNYNRILNQPNAHDIHVGDAENVVLDQLLDPKVFSRVVEVAGKQTIPSQLVKSTPLQYAPKALTTCLESYTQGGAPDSLITNPAFATERDALRALAAKARAEAQSQGAPSADTLAQARVILKALLPKIERTYPAGSPDRTEATNYVKGLYGITKMLQKPDVASFLQGLNHSDTTTLAHLLFFMQSFSLRFGAANSPEQEAAYDQLYPLLVQVRDAAIAPGQASTPFQQTQDAPADPKKVSNFFSGMAMSHFEPQPPPPAQP
jgi:hypothetical protein